MAVPLSYRQRLARKLPRVVKSARQWARVGVSGPRPDTRFVFVVGSQRSGTRLPLEVMDRSPQIATFSEGAAPYFNRVLLQPLDRVEALRRRSVFPVVALKPICETHRVVELLDRFPGSRAVWIFRHYQDAVDSASVKWKSGPEAVRRLASHDPSSAGWRAGGLSAEKLALVRSLYRDDLSRHEANAIMWYLRNGLFFELGADRRDDVLLVRYEDLVAQPAAAFSRMFAFLAVPVPADVERGVKGSTGKRKSFPALPVPLFRLCEDLHERLVAHYQTAAAPRTLDTGPGTP